MGVVLSMSASPFAGSVRLHDYCAAPGSSEMAMGVRLLG